MPLGGEMEIDHGGIQAVMPEVLLDTTDVDAGFQEMGGIAVPESMNGDALFESELLKNASQCSLHGGIAHRFQGCRPLIATPSESRKDPFGVFMGYPVLTQAVQSRPR